MSEPVLEAHGLVKTFDHVVGLGGVDLTDRKSVV